MSRGKAAKLLLRSLPPDFFSLTQEELAFTLAKEFGSQPRFRAKQLHDAVFKKGNVNADSISTLPADLRKALSDPSQFTWGRMAAAEILSSRDGTRKWAWRLGRS